MRIGPPLLPTPAQCLVGGCSKRKTLLKEFTRDQLDQTLTEIKEKAVKPKQKSTNPKKAMGMAKPPMHLIPDSALIHLAMSFKDGAEKYGPYNWRDDPVDATTYIAAMKRHIALWFNGQEMTSDSNVHNLGAVMACCSIILDAQAAGNLIDDRPKAIDLEKLMDQFTVGKGR